MNITIREYTQSGLPEMIEISLPAGKVCPRLPALILSRPTAASSFGKGASASISIL